MKITSIYTYPIKSLRPCSLQHAHLTKHGLQYDRRFMLLERTKDGTRKNMHVAYYPELVLFHTDVALPSDDQARDGLITVTYRPPTGATSQLEVPLEPDAASLDEIVVDMHKSSSAAYKMPAKYSEWFSVRLGFDVDLVYLGPSYRKVLMSTHTSQETQPRSKTWMTSLTDAANAALFGQTTGNLSDEITFADCAPYLIVSEKSMDDVHNRLPEGELMDITKFRPNIIVSGADAPWEEDFWAQLCINDSTKIECVQNCVRCQSLNIDYATGKPGTGPAGKILAKLQKDRRVDAGAKYCPVFGRYSFLHPESEGDLIRVGDSVAVSRRNEHPTTFDWPSLSN